MLYVHSSCVWRVQTSFFYSYRVKNERFFKLTSTVNRLQTELLIRYVYRETDHFENVRPFAQARSSASHPLFRVIYAKLILSSMSRNRPLLISLAREREKNGMKEMRRMAGAKSTLDRFAPTRFSLTVHVTVLWPAVFHLALPRYSRPGCTRFRFLGLRNGHSLHPSSLLPRRKRSDRKE